MNPTMPNRKVNPSAESNKYPWGQFIAASAIGATISVIVTHIVSKALLSREREPNPEMLPPQLAEQPQPVAQRFSRFTRSQELEGRLASLENNIQSLADMIGVEMQ